MTSTVPATTMPAPADPPKTPYADVGLDDLVVRVTILSDLAKAVGALKEAHRSELYRRMARGSKSTAFDPADALCSLGTVSLSNPKPEAYVTDADAFDAFCRVRHPDKIERWVEYTDHDAVAALVAEHAPHLLILHQSVTAEGREEALRQANVEPVPGTGRRLPNPSLTVNTTVHARTAVHALFDTSPVLRELEPPR